MSLDPLLCVADRWRAEMNDDRIAALERRIAELEAQRNPPSTSAPLTQPTHFAQLDRVASAAMPRSVVREMAQAVSDRELREIVRAGNIGEPTSLAHSPSAAPTPRHSQPNTRNGWAPETPLSPPPGVAAIDRLMDAEDAKDRAARRISAALVAAKPNSPK